MARKKKETLNTAVKFKPVKTTADVRGQLVGYQGRVTAKLQQNGYTVKTINTHNSATLFMLQGISKFLVGAFNTQSSANLKVKMSQFIPEYLGVGYDPLNRALMPGSRKLNNEHKIARIKLEKGDPYPDKTGTKFIIPLSAVIHYSMIGSKKINELGLFATEDPETDTLLARVLLNNSEEDNASGEIELAVGMNLLVEWELVIQNT